MRQILKEKVVPNSKLIEYLVYDHHNYEMEVMYKSGKRKGQLRKYSNIMVDDFNHIISSSSPGKALLHLLAYKKAEKGSIVPQKVSFLKKFFSLF